jgi:hypothetical protein
MKKRKKFFGFGKNVFIAGLVSFFMDVSSEMIYPLVPLFLANVLGVNKSVIGLIEALTMHDVKAGDECSVYFYYSDIINHEPIC